MNLNDIVEGSLSEEELLKKMIADLRSLKAGVSGLEKFDADSEVICIEVRAMVGTLLRTYQSQLEKKQSLRKANEELRQ